MKKRISSTILSLIIIIFPIIAQNKIIVSDNLEITKLSDNVYLHKSFLVIENYGKIGANGLLLVEDGKALMIDSPWNDNQTEELYNWLKDSLNTTITTFIPTHWHEDCMGGLGYLQTKGVSSYTNLMTIDIAKEKNLPIPQHGFDHSLFLDFHGIPVECTYLGGGHSTDNIVVWLPFENILFGGCCIKDINSTNLGNLSDADVEAWPSTMRKMIDKFPNAKIVVPGHGPTGGTELMRHTLQLLEK
ncbi:subclass B1 metallo-beta-lactamase [Prevotella sp. 10(H)]|uniref:subclass B1 metallo-beta-lactamase n=1 Tax=Prevotella sp. 10(H) TaxID=1158294 RepID=UPI0004A6D40F|nr:subclass B1 metallo-beta-lactamase [Prevotella sp. 10(H)]